MVRGKKGKQILFRVQEVRKFHFAQVNVRKIYKNPGNGQGILILVVGCMESVGIALMKGKAALEFRSRIFKKNFKKLHSQ